MGRYLSKFADQWLRGLRLMLLVGCIVGLAFGIPGSVGELIVRNEILSEWLRAVLLGSWVCVMALACPVLFEWLARKFAGWETDDASKK